MDTANWNLQGMIARSSSAPMPLERREHVLLVCPPVFSYHLAIKAELEALGFVVTWWNDRGNDLTICKIGLRLMPNVVANLLTKSFLKKLEQLKTLPVTRVLIVKGEGMSLKVLHSLRRLLPHARLSLYFWDSVDNAPRARLIAPLFDSVATFDPVDARRLGWTHRPLFARKESLSAPCLGGDCRYDWCFIGTLHSDRYRIVERLRRSDPTRKVFVFGFAPSRLLMAFHLLSDWSLWTVSRRSISTRAMSVSEVAKVCSTSCAMLDIEHPRQRGLTMRTIETLLSGRKLITTNRHIIDNHLYHPSRVQVISRDAPTVPKSFFETPFEPLDEEIRAAYSLRRWITDLVGGHSHRD